MHKLNFVIGLLMIVLGVAAYLLTGRASVTALIPSFFGVPVVVLGLVALKPNLRTLAGVLTIVLGALGLLGIGGRLVPAILDGSIVFDAATIVQIIFAFLAVDLVVLWVLAFKTMRKNTAHG